MADHNQGPRPSAGRRLAEKIDRGATNDIMAVSELAVGMGKAFASIFIKPFRRMREPAPDQSPESDQ